MKNTNIKESKINMSTGLKPCYECKDTFDEGILMKCELCEEFVCRDCIQWCDEGIAAGLDTGAWDDDMCGADGEILHAGCSFEILEVCDTYLTKTLMELREKYSIQDAPPKLSSYGNRGGKHCAQTFCENHRRVMGGGDCDDCDSFCCANCFELCTVCDSGSCISCGGDCDSCIAEWNKAGVIGISWGCKDHNKKCWNEDCSRGFCEKHESNIQICKICYQYSCFDHIELEHKCFVE